MTVFFSHWVSQIEPEGCKFGERRESDQADFWYLFDKLWK